MFLKKQNNTILLTTHYSLQTRKGFTLVELLVVIGIIAILFAVILIAINPAQRFKDSRNSRRFSDVKAITEATAIYTTDRKGTPPTDIPDYQCIGTKPATVVSDSSPIPRAHWKFDGNTTDSLGAFGGTTSETSYPVAKISQGLSLQNPINGVLVGEGIDNSGLTNALTLEGWIKLNNKLEPGSFDHNQALFDKGNYKMQLNSDTGKLEFETQNGTGMPSDYNTATANIKGIKSFIEFQGSLYAGGIYYTPNNNKNVLLKKSGGIWNIISSAPSDIAGINTLIVYNGKLYSGQNGGKVYSFDGSSWTNTNLEVLTGNADVLSFTRYNGKLYAGVGSGNAGVWEYDGSSWRISKQFDSLTEAVAVYALTVFNGKLYAGTGRSSTQQEARLFEYNGSTWVQKNFQALDGLYSLKEYNKELYLGFGGDNSDNPSAKGKIYKYDGSTFSAVGTADENYVYSLGVFNGVMIAGKGGNFGDGDVYYYNGTDWIMILNSIATEIRSLYSYGGKFYAGGAGATDLQSGIWAYGSNNFISSQKSTWYADSWYHLAGVYDGPNSQMKLFINGSLDATQSVGTANIQLNTLPLNLGIGYSSDALSGTIDDFAVHHSVVPDATISNYAGCYNLAQLTVPEYMGVIPTDPSSTVTDGTNTGYFISKDPSKGTVFIYAPSTEITTSVPEMITFSR